LRCLSAVEWRTAKEGSAAGFAQFVTAKIGARRAAGETLDKIDSL
jgi:hypothetical protein